jgi:ABC-type Na+ efflux pump permease subunit
VVKPYTGPVERTGVDRPAIPASVLNAVKVMYAGAVFSVLDIIIGLTNQSATKTAIRKKSPHLSLHTLNNTVHIAVIGDIVVGVLGALLFIWIARSCRSGKNWARVTATVLCFIGFLGAVFHIIEPEATLNLIASFVLFLIGLAAVVLLWLRSSSAYFKYFKRPEF